MITLKIKNLQILTICTAENKTKEKFNKKKQRKTLKVLSKQQTTKKTKHKTQ